MKRWIILVVLVVGLSAAGTVAVQYLPASSPGGRGADLPLLSGSSNATAGPRPRAVVEQPLTYEFGTMPQRATGKHSWKVKNEGGADLELWMIESTCSCTLAKFKNGAKAVVKPGETTEIDLEYETRENNGDYGKGATIGTNDPSLTSFQLTVHGKVYPAVMTYPPDPVVSYLSISNDADDHYANVAVFSKDRPETKIIKVASSNPKQVLVSYQPLKAEDCQQLKIEKGERVTINVKSGLPLGVFREEVIVTTDHPKQPEVKLTVTGRMSGPIAVVPTVLTMHQVDAKTGGTGEITLAVRSQRPTKFEVVRKPGKLQVEVAPGKQGRYRLTVTVPPGLPAERIEDEIVLKTDHPKADTVIVPMSIWVLNAN